MADVSADLKQAVRQRIWERLQHDKVARFPGAEGRIPNFIGAEAAARLLATRPEWHQAEAVKANPDAPQLPVRAAALEDGKLVYLAVPRLRDARPFQFLDPQRLPVPPRRAASIRGASEHGRPVRIEEMRHVDLIVCGTVATNRAGVRIGKGGGFSDLEFGLAVEAGIVDDDTVIATTVHSLQVVDEDLPETEHDFRLDLIVTPEEVITCPRTNRPPGILWDHLDADKIAEIPVLTALTQH